jgi:hypothetical protein
MLDRRIGAIPNNPFRSRCRAAVSAPRVALQLSDGFQHETSPQNIWRYIQLALPHSISQIPSSSQSPSLIVSTSKLTYAPKLNAVKTTTAFPLVLNFFLPMPSSPTSLKNCLFPSYLRYKLTSMIPTPYVANRAPML